MSPGMQNIYKKLLELQTEKELGSSEDEHMAEGRVIDAVNALPMSDWASLCDALLRGML